MIYVMIYQNYYDLNFKIAIYIRFLVLEIDPAYAYMNYYYKFWYIYYEQRIQ